MPPDSLHRPAVAATESPATSAHRGPTLLPIRPASKLPLRSKKESDPSCLQRGGASVLSRVFPRQTRESPFFGRFDRLAVQHCNARFCFSIGSEANRAAQAIVKSVKRSVEAPSAVAAMNRRVIGKVTGQVAPLAASAHQIKNRIDNLTAVELWRTTGRLPGKQRCNLHPLLVGQVRRVSASHDGCMFEKESLRLTLQA